MVIQPENARHKLNAKGSNDRLSNIGACNTASSLPNINQSDEANAPLINPAISARCSDDGQAVSIPVAAFKGANPHRAYERGVKLVGATAHYVTPDLYEGRVITPDVSIVDHADKVEDLIAQGQDTERCVLSRAVKLHLEHRVMLNGNRTIVFK